MRQWIVFLLLGSVILLAAVIRFYNLSSVPPSPYLDEVSNGYNAYSLMLTGNDEYGRHLPLLLQAFNDFRPAIFVYTLIPFIKLFGLSTFAIRLPSAFLSILTTLSLFFLTRELFANKKEQIKNYLALCVTFLFAISPWSIYSSHISDEINMGLSFFVFALTFFIYALNTRGKNKKSTIAFFASIILFVIAFYSYHGIKLFLPFFIICAALIFFKELWSRKKELFLGIFLGVFLLIPLFIALRAPGATVRLGAVNAVSQQPQLIALSSQRILHDKSQHDTLGEIFDNRRLLLTLEVMRNYFKNYDPGWLFLQLVGNKTYMIPDFGPFYLFELPLLLLGIYSLIKQDTISNKTRLLIIAWVIAAAIPSALSSEAPHLNRTNTMLPIFTILEGMGLFSLILVIKKVKTRFVPGAGFVIAAGVIGISFVWFLHAYFVAYPYTYSKVYQYGATLAFQYAKEHEDKYKKIVVSNADEFLEGYMYYLFATKYDPKQYQKQGGTHSAFFTDTHLIGKYDFRNPNWEPPLDKRDNQTSKEKVLYIVNPNELSSETQKRHGLYVIQSYRYLDGTDAVWIMEGDITVQ